MFGQTETFILGVSLTSGIACFTDLFRGKIFNWLTLPALACGIVFSIYFSGMHGLQSSLMGAAAGLLFFGWMFFVGIMGGGDVKLLVALGAWGGAGFAEEVALLSVLVGGIFAICSMIFRGKLVVFLKKIYFFFLTLFVKELEVALPKVDENSKIPFGVPMALAAVWTILAHPVAGLGVPIWPS